MRKFLSLCSCMMAVAVLSAQHIKPGYKGEIIGSADKTALTATYLGKISPMKDSNKVRWMKSINRVASYTHGTPTELSKLKAELMEEKLTAEIEAGNRPATRASEPVLGTNFLGNTVSYSTPPDNCMAISNGGKIVSSDNNSIAFYNQNGSGIMLNEAHEDWFWDVAPSLSITSSLFDPRVVYDPVEDRFIFVILHGSSYYTSKIIVCFSETNNPANDWHAYEVSGNPLNDASWFDYPNIAISGEDIFISGNLFYSAGGFNESVVYQLDKHAGYNGNSMSYLVYDNIPGGTVGAFTLVPAGYGQSGEYGPGIYLVSSNYAGNTRINLYEVTDDLSGNPSLNLNASVNVDQYTASADALQQGWSEGLNTNDARMQHAFYLNGMVHAVHHINYSAGYTGIAYYRIPVDDPSEVMSSRYGESGFDIAFPSIASFGLEENDRSVMIGFLKSGSSIYPSIGVVNCDNMMEWSPAAIVKAGEGYINHSYVYNLERWGDYSDMQRKHNETEPEVWMVGCFGPPSHVWNTWIAEVKGVYEPAPVPIADFIGDTLEGYPGLMVAFSDSSLNNPASWSWSFEGGVPATSIYQYPTVSYEDTGWFDVKLVVNNQFGSDSIMREQYIHVKEVPPPPAGLDEDEAERSISVYPNPAQAYELVHIDIDNPQWAEVDIEIIDVQGRMVRSMYSDRMKPGLHRLSFNKLALTPGQYFITVRRDGQQTQHEKVIVQ